MAETHLQHEAFDYIARPLHSLNGSSFETVCSHLLPCGKIRRCLTWPSRFSCPQFHSWLLLRKVHLLACCSPMSRCLYSSEKVSHWWTLQAQPQGGLRVCLHSANFIWVCVCPESRCRHPHPESESWSFTHHQGSLVQLGERHTEDLKVDRSIRSTPERSPFTQVPGPVF